MGLRRALIAIVSAGLLAACGAPTAIAADTASPFCIPRGTPVPQGPAEQVAETAVAGTDGRLRRVTLSSPALGRTTNVNVLLPRSYDPSGGTRYPVLYLLHGALGTYNDWHAAGGVIGIVDAVSREHDLPPFIVVMPDGGTWGFYSDWYGTDVTAQSPEPPPAWTQHHIRELIPWVDANLPSVAGREGRAVAGLSMGGFGAMSYAARFPHLFSAAGSFSGAVHPNLDYPAGNAFLTAASVYFDPGKVHQCLWGDMLTQQVHWQGHDPTYLAENLSATSLFIASGGGDEERPGGLASDPVEETCFLMSRAFARALDAEGIGHTDDFYGSGTHTWPYWQQGLRRFLPQMAAAWADPPPAPPQQPFSHRSIRPRFEAWGWSFEAHRESTEFTYVDGVDAGGLAVTGSGTLDVVSAALYRPRAFYSVGDDVVRADRAGRLHFTVDLGAPHPSQQQRFDDAALADWRRVEVAIERVKPR